MDIDMKMHITIYYDKLKKTHGMSKTRLYSIYRNMHSRCENPNIKKYKYYGARGIKVCDEWSGENGFINFKNWAMENGYSDNLTIDRRNNDGNYEPSNCRFATYIEQNRNMSSNHILTIGGKSQTISEWSEESGLSRKTIESRLNRGLENENLISERKKFGGCSSGVVGVQKRTDYKNTAYRATITKNNIKYDLGTYSELDDAIEAREKAEFEMLRKDV